MSSKESANGSKNGKPTKAPTAAQIAKTRRDGATWNQVREKFGLKWPSGKWTAILREGGFDAGGAKPGQKSKAVYRDKAKVAK